MLNTNNSFGLHESLLKTFSIYSCKFVINFSINFIIIFFLHYSLQFLLHDIFEDELAPDRIVLLVSPMASAATLDRAQAILVLRSLEYSFSDPLKGYIE